ncbi:MAG TPA: cytochrome C biogenesis protein [Phycisphaeraceae bacterium]|nr:cytochrome C biogenesis protein [Phycisphaeraceae bacterium]
MFQELFTNLSHAVEGTPAVAVAAAVVWGILSILLSPCHLASIPLIVAFINGQGNRLDARRAFLLSSLFALGILLTIAVIGVVTAALGRMMGDAGKLSSYLVAAVLLFVGLHFLGVLPLPKRFSACGVDTQRRGRLAAFLLGLTFGIALGPCTFAYMAPMLAVSFRLATHNPFYGAFLLACYGLGHCSVIIFAGTFTEIVQRYLNWTERSRGAVILRGTCGVLVIVAGLYLVYIT